MFLRIGHRGAGGYFPENTLLSFREAIELHVDMIELDVHLCKTGEPVVIHDDGLDRTTDGTGVVAGKTLEQLRVLNAGMGQKIPLLSEVLDLVNKRVMINIELKGESTSKSICNMIEQYVKRRRWSYTNFLVSSFHVEELKNVFLLNPSIKIGVLTRDSNFDLEWMSRKLHAYSIHLPVKFATKEVVENCHAKGLKVFAFTVNDFNSARRLKLIGVDGAFSDFPDRI